MQGTRVRFLVQEYPTCLGAPKPVCHNYWACALEPVLRNKRSHHNKSVHHNDTTRESPCTAMNTQISQKKKKKNPLLTYHFVSHWILSAMRHKEPELHWVQRPSVWSQLRDGRLGFPGGAVVENPSANAGDTGLSLGPGRSHMLQLLKPMCLEPVLHNKRSHHNEKPTHHSEE